MISENPKAFTIALTGIVIFLLRTYVFQNTFSPELESWLNVLLPSIFLFAFGWFTRITKTEANLLESDKKYQDKNYIKN